jgi:hypothetical protein
MLQIASIWSTPASMFLFPWGESTVTLEDDVLGGLPLLSRPRRDVLLLQLFFDWSCCWYGVLSFWLGASAAATFGVRCVRDQYPGKMGDNETG